MRKSMFATGIAVAALLPGLALAETQIGAPNVTVDIAPLHSLVAEVMEGVGQPTLILPPGADPHEYALRPSQASALNEAKVIFWMGDALEPWLSKALTTLGGKATTVAMLDLPQTEVLPFREGLEPSGAGHDEAHNEAMDHDHDSNHDGDDHDEHKGHHHEAGELDPHAWLAPENALTWLPVIADTLAKADPEHADQYQSNAREAEADLKADVKQIHDMLDGDKPLQIIVSHDAFHYFEHDFDIENMGAVTDANDAPASAARYAKLESTLAKDPVTCFVSVPGQGKSLQDLPQAGENAHFVTIDPLGADFAPGPDLYSDLLMDIGTKLSVCRD